MKSKGWGALLFIYFISKASAKVALTLSGWRGGAVGLCRIIHHRCHPESAPRSRRRDLPSVSAPKLLILKPLFKHCPDGLHSHHNLTGLPHQTCIFLAPQLPPGPGGTRGARGPVRTPLVDHRNRLGGPSPTHTNAKHSCLPLSHTHVQRESQVRAGTPRGVGSMHIPFPCLSSFLPGPPTRRASAPTHAAGWERGAVAAKGWPLGTSTHPDTGLPNIVATCRGGPRSLSNCGPARLMGNLWRLPVQAL